MGRDVFDIIIMLRFCEAKVAKETFYSAKKVNIWNANVDNIVISKLVRTKTNKLIASIWMDI